MAISHERRHVVAVFDDEDEARTAAQALRAAGVGERAVTVDQPSVDVESLEAEMQAEMTDSWVSPQAAVAMPKEGVKGMAVLMPALMLLGAVLALPLGFIQFGGEMELWLRLVIAAAIGALTGATVAWLWGAARVIEGPAAPLAAERGTTLRVESADAQVIDILSRHHPIRVDILDEENRLLSHIDEGAPSVTEELTEGLTEPEGDWSRTPATGR